MNYFEISKSRVVETRVRKTGEISRRRKTPDGRRFSTIERIALLVSDEKRTTERWNFDKLYDSIEEASSGRLTDEQITKIISESLGRLLPKRIGMQKRVISARRLAETVFNVLEEVDEVAAVCYGATCGVGILSGNSSLDSISGWLEKRGQTR